MSEPENKEKTEDENKFKSIVNEKNLNEMKDLLTKMKMILEKKLEDKLQEVIEVKQELPHLIHLKRINKLQKGSKDDS